MTADGGTPDHDEGAMLHLLAETVLPQAVRPEIAAYCPNMDLLALVTVDEQLQVVRLNGQRVFSIAPGRDRGQVRSVRWKPDGRRARTGRRAPCD